MAQCPIAPRDGDLAVRGHYTVFNLYRDRDRDRDRRVRVPGPRTRAPSPSRLWMAGVVLTEERHCALTGTYNAQTDTCPAAAAHSGNDWMILRHFVVLFVVQSFRIRSCISRRKSSARPCGHPLLRGRCLRPVHMSGSIRTRRSSARASPAKLYSASSHRWTVGISLACLRRGVVLLFGGNALSGLAPIYP